MSVKIRLKQIGKRNSREFRIVVVDESKKRDGAVIEELGTLESRGKTVNLKKERIDYWRNVGAQISPRIYKLLTSA